MSETLHRSVRPLPDEAPLEQAGGRLWRDPRYQAFWMLRLGYTAIPLAMGIDKFFYGLVYWPKYLADWIDNIAPGTAQQFMYFVGIVEIVAVLLVLLKPRYAAYVVAAWLAGIVINLFSYGRWYDVGVRDLGLMAARSCSAVSPPSTTRRCGSVTSARTRKILSTRSAGQMSGSPACKTGPRLTVG
jgi:uncharacterized membrane protein YphA (DoxX/SURF4 family)